MMLYFIFTEEFGFEKEWHTTVQDAQRAAHKLMEYQAYIGKDITILEVDEAWVNEGGSVAATLP